MSNSILTSLLDFDNNSNHKLKGQDHVVTKQQEPKGKSYKWDIVWFNVVVFIYLYASGIYGLYLSITTCTWKTLIWSIFLVIIGSLGHTAGSHRLWTHRSYKANLPLRIILAFFSTICFENHIYEWVRDHRVHHKYTDTDADPHNSTRGFFFSHCGWLMVRKHKDVIEKGKNIDLSDLEADPVIMFQKRYYAILMPLCCFILPTVVPWYFWNEPFHVAFYVAGIGRYIWNVNGTWLVNSAAHIYGTKPYDKSIEPRENVLVGYLAFGEGWHNYHHTFPWDYKTSELGDYGPNLTLGFIDFFAKFGWAYDLKTASPDVIRKRMLRTGDGSKLVEKTSMDENSLEETSCNAEEEHIWGWGDKNMKEKDFECVRRFNVK